MTPRLTDPATNPASLKPWQKMLLGALVGGGVCGMLLSLTGDVLDLRHPDVVMAIAAGLSYLLIGALVLAGLARPSSGARFLNVADAEELTEERPKLLPSALSCMLIGAGFLGLAFAPALPIGPLALALLLAVAAAIVAAISLPAMRRYDELTHRLSSDSAALTLYWALAVLGPWAILAYLGLAPWITPLGFLAALAILMLFAIFWTAARRGLLNPR
jgi:hypothetical protein